MAILDFLLPAITLGLTAVGVGASILGGIQEQEAAEDVAVAERAQNTRSAIIQRKAADVQDLEAGIEDQAAGLQDRAAEIQRLVADIQEQEAAILAEAARIRGEAEFDASAFQAVVLRNNRDIARDAAIDALDRGQIAETQRRIETRQVIGLQRATLAANGVVVDRGSGLTLTADTAAIGELDALTVRSNAEREALGFRALAMNFEAEARLEEMSGQSALRAAQIDQQAAGLTAQGAEITRQRAALINTEANITRDVADITRDKADLTREAADLTGGTIVFAGGPSFGNILGSALTGTAQVAQQWYNFNRQGAFG